MQRGEETVASCMHDMDSLSGMSAHPRDRQAQVGLWALPVRLKPRLNTSQASQKKGVFLWKPRVKHAFGVGSATVVWCRVSRRNTGVCLLRPSGWLLRSRLRLNLTTGLRCAPSDYPPLVPPASPCLPCS